MQLENTMSESDKFILSWTEYSVSVKVVLAKCTVYQLKQDGRKVDTRTPESSVTYGSESDRVDIAGFR